MLQGFNHLEVCMNAFYTLLVQIMDFAPWKTLGRIVLRRRGYAGVRRLSCIALFRIMAIAQLTWSESLNDIAEYLTANQSKPFHMGTNHILALWTLPDALYLRYWSIYHAMSMLLIDRARRLYAKERMGVDLDTTVNALDHSLLDLCGAIHAFINISDGKMHAVM
jgi:hypothetical protein